MTSHNLSPTMTSHKVYLLFGTLCIASLTSGLTSDLFLSTAETAVLLESEEQLLGFVHQCLTQTARRTGNAEYNRLARDLQSERRSLPQTQDARHPVDAYVGLRRFTQYWDKYIATMDPLVARSVEKSLAQNRLVYPDSEVLQQARLAIVRLQAAYNLSASHLASTATANLTDSDTASLAAEAEGTGFPLVAEGWRMLGTAYASQGGHAEGELLNHHRHSESNQVVHETQTLHRRNAKFFSLCQHFQDIDDVTALRSEGCVYTRGSIPLNRWKTEVLSRDPYIVLYYDFVTDREADTMVKRAMVKLTRALTGPTPNDFTLKAHRRLGKIAWLRDNSSSVFERVSRRAHQVTGLHTAFRPRASFGEDFQVVNYGIGGHYIPHHDYFKTKNAFSVAETYLKDSGDRAATFMIYLGDVSLGGATVFPDLGVGAPPVKNAALFWYNFNPDGLRDPRTLHGGCPVIIGQKWVANKWIHEISTAMTKTCRTSPWKPVNT
ncbi:prolyl 4-hydroxylase subunit alpha-3-like [Littorina saxatilis]|uniref:procollagen-proline 4-dioxygenase n=1 Tax=Littorina saxatilis TaxID=31220 RepID=A0AAN9GNF1_9CAEN